MTAVAPDGFDALEADIYEAALIPERWIDVLSRLATLSGGVGAVLWSSRDGHVAWRASPGMFPITERFVREGWGRANPRFERAREKGLTEAVRFYTEADVFDCHCYLREPFFADFLLPHGLGWSAATAINVPGHDHLAISIERARADGPIPAASIVMLDRLRPHLARASLIAARLAFERSRTAIDTLAQLGYAAASISADGKILLANAGFEAADGGWSIRGGDRIGIDNEATQSVFADALARLGTSGGVRSIPLPSSRRKVDAVMHLVPIRGEAEDLFARAGALVIVTRSSGVHQSPELIQTLFDLTPAEAVVARWLSRGESVDDIARLSGKSVLTIRTQVKSVLAKTGTRRQSELVDLLARLVPPAL